MRHIKKLNKLILHVVFLSTLLVGGLPAVAYAGTTCGDKPHVTVNIDIGCVGKGNPIMDGLFGIIRFLSDGVGIVVVGSIIMGGIQYAASAGDPQATQKAIGRIRSSLIALLVFLFAYPLLNYLIPKGFLQ